MADQSYVAETRRLLALALSHQNSGDHAAAAGLHRQIARRHPAVAVGWLQAAVSAQAAGEASCALDDARHALILEPGLGAGTAVLAAVAEGSERHPRATDMWALTNPTNAAALGARASVLQQQGRAGPALASARAALRLDPLLVWVRVNLAVVQRDLGDAVSAGEALRRAAVVAPGDGLVWRRVAGLREVLSDLPGAELAAGRALVVDPSDHAAAFVRALVDRRQHRLDRALARLRALPQALDGEVGRDAVEFELGSVLDRLGEPAAAYGHFERGNEIAAGRAAPGAADPAPYLDIVTAFEESMEARWRDRWTSLGDAEPPMVFMVGFPRSGTTLLDQILDAHPDIRVIEEQPVLAGLGAAFAQPPQRVPARLAELNDVQAARLRSGLVERMERWAGSDRPRIVVDKMPLNTVYLPLALRIYPRAKVILSLRHPCDCCLSCFMQPIRLNPAMANFTTMAGTTALYARVMGIWERVAADLSPDHAVVRYEDLIGDVEGTARRVLDFLGAEWNDAVIDHTGHARSRGIIRTPSFRQVSEPIYTRARGRWEKYRPQMAPHLDRLRPFIARFGYEDPERG